MARKSSYTPAGAALSALILEVFRLNGRLLTAGDRLVSEIGLTSARWQVLGAISLADKPEPVAHLARSMGLSRQGLQRIVNELALEGLVELTPNPRHERAKLVILTQRGRQAYEAAGKLQRAWVNLLTEGLQAEALVQAGELLKALRRRLESDPADFRNSNGPES